MDNIFTIIIGIVAVLGSGLISFFVSRKSTKNKIDAGKEIGASEQKDEDRKEAVNAADEQIERNEDVIKRSRDAIKKARELRNEEN